MNAEQERIAAYQRGWNDAQRQREPQRDAGLLYSMGYIDAKRGNSPRVTGDRK